MKLIELCKSCEIVCGESGKPNLDCIDLNDDRIPDEEVPKLMAEVVIFETDQLMKGLNERR